MSYQLLISVFSAPWVVSYIFPLVKPIISGKTLPKIEFFDSNPQNYKPTLAKMLPNCYLKDIIGITDESWSICVVVVVLYF